MSIIDEIKEAASSFALDVEGDERKLTLKKVVAERKVFLSKKKLEYRATIKLDDAQKSLDFSEMLKESGFGLSTGGGDLEMSSGFGFKAVKYSVGTGGRSGTIQEQSELFGKQYTYDFKYEEVRKKIEEIASKSGYKFNYKIV